MLLPNKTDLFSLSNWILRLSFPTGLDLAVRLYWVRFLFKVQKTSTLMLMFMHCVSVTNNDNNFQFCM